MARILTDEERAQHERVTGRFGDARAQLWARVYAAEFASTREESRLLDQQRGYGQRELEAARRAANAAVRDFDEHYLGGK